MAFENNENFKIYGNLLFYNNHEPDYFYFNSLLTYSGTTPEYAVRAKEVAKSGFAALKNPPTFSNDNGEEMPAL